MTDTVRLQVRVFARPGWRPWPRALQPRRLPHKLGFVRPGERFPAERGLATQLGVSRITLREAIRALQQAGYVESRRGRFGGTFVTSQPPRQDVAELRRLAREEGEQLTDALTFRMAVETGAAQVLATHVRDHDHCARDRITEALRARLADLAAAGPADYRRLDTLFHLAIADLTGSVLLAAASTDARMRLNDLLNAIPALWRNIENTAPQHAAIRGRHPRGRSAGGDERGHRASGGHRGTAPRLPGLETR